MTRATSSPALTPPPAAGPATQATVHDAATVQPALVDGIDIDALARAVRACAGVAELYSGRFGEIGSYLPGRRVSGVLVDDTSVTVHIRARWGYGVRDLFAQISAVTVALRRGRRLDLVVDDIDDDLTGTGDSAVTAVTAVAPPLALEPAHAMTDPDVPLAPSPAPFTLPTAGTTTPPPESSTS